MDEGELLDMGRRLITEHAKLEVLKQKWLTEKLQIQKKLSLLYAYGRELDMLIESDSTFPLIIKFMVERIRGISSSLIWREADEEDNGELNVHLND